MEPAATFTHSARLGPREARHRRAMVIVDCAMIAAAIGLGVAMGWGESWTWSLFDDTARMTVIIALAVIWPMMLWDLETRATTIIGDGPEEYRRVLMASLWTLAFAAAIAYATGTVRARPLLLGTALVGIALLFAGRNVMRTLLHRRLKEGDPLHRVFIVAPTSQAELIGEQLQKSRGVFGEVGVWPLGDDTDPDPVVVVKAARDASADTLLYAPANHADSTWPRRLGWAMEDTDLSLLVSPAIAEIAGPRLAIEPVQGLALVRVEMPRFSGPARTVKRAMDLLLGAGALAIFAIPMLIMAAAIKTTSDGPVFFRQQRAAAGGSTFSCWKFRTMYVGADADRAALRAQSDSESATFKMEQDPRVTKAGRFLRRFSMDELPQLFNVLLGDMSLVGPRPHPLDDVELYDDVATRRLLAKPGMTGLWQVSGRSSLGWKEAVMLDLYYVENWSISLDLIIMLRTAKAVATGKGAY